MRGRITKVIEDWFLSEPLMFQVFCAHEIVENTSMKCAVRSGQQKIEYNSYKLYRLADNELNETLKVEAIRILMKHPYMRKPDSCSDEIAALGSDVTVGDNYKFELIDIETPRKHMLKSGMSYEYYCHHLRKILTVQSGEESQTQKKKQSNDQEEQKSPANNLKSNRKVIGGGGCGLPAQADMAALWEEDDLMSSAINEIIQNAQNWGSLSAGMVETLKASTKARINWRNVLSGFRASILSSRRIQTRMRPNRRTEFDNPGSRRDFDTRLLVAVDVSGSVSSKAISDFYSVVNRAFKYGITEIDVCQFDTGIKSVQKMRKQCTYVKVKGRGDTSFQEPVDYAIKNDYDGLIFLTDGYAPRPKIPKTGHCKILWVCVDEESFEKSKEWMQECGRVCTMQLG